MVTDVVPGVATDVVADVATGVVPDGVPATDVVTEVVADAACLVAEEVLAQQRAVAAVPRGRGVHGAALNDDGERLDHALARVVSEVVF